MKVLFLDIDGVLNGHEKHPDSPYTTIRPDCVQRLNQVIRATRCSLVISSAWRYMLLKTKKRHPPAMSATGFQYMLHTHGLRFCANGSQVLGATCADEAIAARGGQILDWLARHPETERWAAVDDMHFGKELGKHRWRLVYTQSENGLQDREVARLIKILGREK